MSASANSVGDGFAPSPCRLAWQRDWYLSDNPARHWDHADEKHPLFETRAWNNKGGSRRKDGYLMVWIKGKKVLAHRLVMEEKIGRPLARWEIVHHVDGDRTNNNPTNLIIMSQADHMRIHLHAGHRNTPQLPTGEQALPG